MHVGFKSITITNYNQIDFEIELDLTDAPEPEYWTFVQVDTVPITSSSQGRYAFFVSQIFDDETGYYYLTYSIGNLDYNTTYYCEVDVRTSIYPSDPIVISDNDTIDTEQDPTYIYDVKITQKKHKAYIDITIHVLTDDQYGVEIEYNRIETPQIVRNAIYISEEQVTDQPYYIFHYRIINLKGNKKYQYKIKLNNLTHNQLVQELTGNFTSLPDDWKLWMYLHYYI